MRQASRIQCGDEVIAASREFTDHIGEFKVDEVFGRLRIAQFRLARRTPAVSAQAQIFNLVDGRRATQEGWKIGRKVFGGEAVDHPMPVAAPSEAGGRGQQAEHRIAALGRMGARKLAFI